MVIALDPVEYLSDAVASIAEWVPQGDGFTPEDLERLLDGVDGFIDRFLDSINPLDAWWSIPDRGPTFGHVDAYNTGGIIGSVFGVATGMMIGAAGAGGLFACGSVLQKAAAIYTAVGTAAGMVSAGYHLMTGQASWADAIALLPAASFVATRVAGASGLLQLKCFVAGTKVVTGQGPNGPFFTTPIEDLQVGDEVLSRDQDDPDGPLVKAKITNLFRHVAFDLQTVTIQNGGATETFSVTDGHPFYVDGVGWVGAGELVAGQHVLLPDGSWATVVSDVDEPHPEGVVVYNFEVEGTHTYFVEDGFGENNFYVWVHNSGCGPTGRIHDVGSYNHLKYTRVQGTIKSPCTVQKRWQRFDCRVRSDRHVRQRGSHPADDRAG